MPLPELDLKISYRSSSDDLVGDFFVPCLEQSVEYRRAAGYFSSAGLALAARGVADVASRGGVMRLVASPCLLPEDVEALEKAAKDPVSVLKGVSARCLVEIEDQLVADHLNALAWLAAAGLLEVKIAFRTDQEGKVTRGIFHEKIGIFTDEKDNHVAFSGSSNETVGGLLENFESIKVFTSQKDSERVAEELENFEALWNNETVGLRVVNFTDVSRELLESFRDPDRPPQGLTLATKVAMPARSAGFQPPVGFELRDYQADAIRAWIKNGGSGILAMATGSGKTFTALTLASKVAEKNTPLVIIVVCPFINLCRQWIGEFAAFGLSALACFEGRKKWLDRFEECYQRIAVGLSKIEAMVTTNTTFQGEAFQALLHQHSRSGSFHHLIIADEVHNLGAKNVSSKLPDAIKLRLGLSATPERYLDPEGTQAVIDYFGDIVYEFPLDRAIAEGHLCRYRYHPVLVSLTDEEAGVYAEITAKLGRILGGAEDDAELKQVALNLLVKRARLIATAKGKEEALDRLIGSMEERPEKAIFYCGDGKSRDKITDEEVKQIKAVARILGEKHQLRVRNFTYQESAAEREEILRDLESGFLDGVVAIRCLDEGIDLPDLRMGFLLASSTNPRQFVQRRGRLLRRAEGKKRAEIFDFIVTPPDLGGRTDDDAFNIGLAS